MITINWATGVITVPKSYLTLVSGTVYQLDLNQFRLDLKQLESQPEGMDWPATHEHNTTVTLSGVPYARLINMINGYTITFEDGQYAVNLVGANSNVADVTNVNQVSIRPFNSAGLIEVSTSGGSGASAAQIWNHSLEGSFTAAQLMTLIASILAGKTTIVPMGNGLAEIMFRNVSDTADKAAFQVQGSERISTDIDP